jgi:hypothetical protein
MGQYDILWKGMVESVFDDMMRFIFPYIDQEVDLGRGVEFLDKELAELYPEPEKSMPTRVMDKLAKVYVKNGGEQWVLIHLEVQGWNDPLFTKRMFQSFYRAFDRYDRPVAAIAIFTDRVGKNGPDRYQHFFLESGVDYHYKTLFTGQYTEEELIRNENAFAVVLLIAKMTALRNIRDEDEFDAALLERKTLVAEILYTKRQFSEEKHNAIMVFLDNYLVFNKPEINRIFMERVDNYNGKTNTMGILEQFAEIKAQEGLEKGRMEERERIGRRFVEYLLANTDFSLEKIAFEAGVSLDFVNKIKEGIRTK